MMEFTNFRRKPSVLFHGTEQEYPLNGYPEHMLGILQEHFELVPISQYNKDPELKTSIEGVITEGGDIHGQLTPIINSLPSLRVISSNGVGYDHLLADIASYRVRRIQVGHTPNYATRATADFTFALLLASARNLISAAQEARYSQDNNAYNYNCSLGATVGGATIGIVGMGRIGYGVAQRARGFDMTVLYHDLNRRPAEEERSVKATYYSDLTQMVPLCDYLVICCPLTPDTRHLISRQVLSLMKKSATLVNTARGIVVDTDALVDALETGSIRGAALDVTDPEPLPEGHPLLTLPNALVTAHRGFCDQAAQEHLWQETCDILKAVLIDNDDIPKHCRLC